MSVQVHCDFCNKSLFDVNKQRARSGVEAPSFELHGNSERWGSGPFEEGRLDFCNEGCAGAYFLERQREKADS